MRSQVLIPSMQFTSSCVCGALQCAISGGKIDATDRDEIDAALRELTEETGIERSDVDILGVLPDAVARSKRQTIVTPVIGMLRRDLARLPLVRVLVFSFAHCRRQFLSHTSPSIEF